MTPHELAASHAATLSLFRGARAVAEAITWALLLTGMFLKYVTETTELGVQVFGMVHGVVFIAYCLVTVLVAIDQRWSLGRARARAASPRCRRSPRCSSRCTPTAAGCSVTSGSRATTARPRLSARVCWLLRHHRLAAGLLVVAVAGLTGVALVVGPPA